LESTFSLSAVPGCRNPGKSLNFPETNLEAGGVDPEIFQGTTRGKLARDFNHPETDINGAK
jgi:hypothetical protein